MTKPQDKTDHARPIVSTLVCRDGETRVYIPNAGYTIHNLSPEVGWAMTPKEARRLAVVLNRIADELEYGADTP